jgi:hypothetical protein
MVVLSNSSTELVSHVFLFRIYLRYDYIVLGCWIRLNYNFFLPRLRIYWRTVSHSVNDGLIIDTLYASSCIRNRVNLHHKRCSRIKRVGLLITGFRGEVPRISKERSYFCVSILELHNINPGTFFLTTVKCKITQKSIFPFFLIYPYFIVERIEGDMP